MGRSSLPWCLVGIIHPCVFQAKLPGVRGGGGKQLLLGAEEFPPKKASPSLAGPRFLTWHRHFTPNKTIERIVCHFFCIFWKAMLVLGSVVDEIGWRWELAGIFLKSGNSWGRFFGASSESTKPHSRMHFYILFKFCSTVVWCQSFWMYSLANFGQVFSLSSLTERKHSKATSSSSMIPVDGRNPGASW